MEYSRYESYSGFAAQMEQSVRGMLVALFKQGVDGRERVQEEMPQAHRDQKKKAIGGWCSGCRIL